MKTNLKFLMALGGAKLVALDNPGGAPLFYGHAEPLLCRAKRTDIRRIADALKQPK